MTTRRDWQIAITATALTFAAVLLLPALTYLALLLVGKL